jgi:hypothetical protein
MRLLLQSPFVWPRDRVSLYCRLVGSTTFPVGILGHLGLWIVWLLLLYNRGMVTGGFLLV